MTVKNRTYIDMNFLTGNDLSHKLRKLWRFVVAHSVYIIQVKRTNRCFFVLIYCELRSPPLLLVPLPVGTSLTSDMSDVTTQYGALKIDFDLVQMYNGTIFATKK